MKIVGFGHRKLVGKDSAANFLVSHIRANTRGKLVRKTGFASKFKAILNDLYGWAGVMDEEYYEIHPELKDSVLSTIGMSPRQIWIEFGTTVGRAIYPDTWVVYPFTLKSDYLIFKDVRFPNEADKILAEGGRVYRVDNPRVAPTSDKADDPLATYTEWSGILVNDGTMAELNLKTIQLVKGYIDV